MPSFKEISYIWFYIYVYKYYIIILVYQDINIIFPWKEFMHVQNKDEDLLASNRRYFLNIYILFIVI